MSSPTNIDYHKILYPEAPITSKYPTKYISTRGSPLTFHPISIRSPNQGFSKALARVSRNHHRFENKETRTISIISPFSSVDSFGYIRVYSSQSLPSTRHCIREIELPNFPSSRKFAARCLLPHSVFATRQKEFLKIRAVPRQTLFRYCRDILIRLQNPACTASVHGGKENTGVQKERERERRP